MITLDILLTWQAQGCFSRAVGNSEQAIYDSARVEAKEPVQPLDSMYFVNICILVSTLHAQTYYNSFMLKDTKYNVKVNKLAVNRPH